jgi:hypothetical protein
VAAVIVGVGCGEGTGAGGGGLAAAWVALGAGARSSFLLQAKDARIGTTATTMTIAARFPVFMAVESSPCSTPLPNEWPQSSLC